MQQASRARSVHFIASVYILVSITIFPDTFNTPLPQPVLLLTHHKTGSMLMAGILDAKTCGTAFHGTTIDKIIHGLRTYNGICWLRDLILSPHGTPIQNKVLLLKRMHWRIIHMMRDPLEMVVSAYVYHKVASPIAREPWLNVTQRGCSHMAQLTGTLHPTSWRSYLRHADERTGLSAQYEMTMEQGIHPMTELFLATRDSSFVLHVRLEQLLQQFNTTLSTAFRFIGVSTSEFEHSIERAHRTRRTTVNHISPTESKPRLRQIITQDLSLCSRLVFFQRLLQYRTSVCTC
jgi:hypothetical protein